MNKDQKKIAIIGTVGLPPNYGGWETLVNNIVEILSNKYQINVFCSSKRYLKKIKTFKGANLIYLNLDANGLQSIFYDFLSMWRSRNKVDIQLVLGISGCIFIPFLKRFGSSKYVVNIDGIEWKREKWSFFTKQFLKLSEMFAVKYADYIICDNKGIYNYVLKKYKKESFCIPYGGDHTKKTKVVKKPIQHYSLPENFAFKVARIEPENNIDMILNAFKNSQFPFVIVGNWGSSSYGKKMKKFYNDVENIIILDAIYDQEKLDLIRSKSILYIHGHSAGGTNPSLVEAMYLGLPIIAFDVCFNRYTTEEKAYYFKNSLELEELLRNFNSNSYKKNRKNMKSIAKSRYRWELIAEEYLKIFNNVYRHEIN